MLGKNKKENKKKKDNLSEKLFSSFVTDKEKYYLVENLSMLVASGMSIIEALESIVGGIKSNNTKKIILNIKKEVNNGISLWIALDNSRLFSDYAISLIKTGEKSGRLSENLDIISSNHQKERIFKSKLRSAMMYPMLVFALSVVVGVGIAWFILPRLATVFSQLRLELPLITKILIGIGNFLGEYGAIFIPSIIVLMTVILFFVFFFKKTKMIGQYILFSIPFVRGIVQEIELARAGFILGTLINAGLPAVEAIQSLSEITSSHAYQNFYKHLRDKIEEGQSFEEVFGEYPKIEKLMPQPIQQMIVTGEKSGRLADTLIRVGENYDSKMDTTTKNLSILIEPILLVIVWVGVVFVSLAVILPIYSLIGGLNQSSGVSPQNSSGPPVEVSIEEGVIEIEPSDEIVEQQVDEVVSDVLGRLVISETETGYLNVRSNSSVQGDVVGRVEPGEEYDFIEEDNNWYYIILSDDEERITGWVISSYVELINE
ncbi:type II secretion system F family protein [Patescibacteria group bacterium]